MWLEDFQVPLNQDVIGAKMFWGGNLLGFNPQRSGKFTALAA